MLANNDDKHSIKVFDPTIKGQTDRFAYRFREALTGPPLLSPPSERPPSLVRIHWGMLSLKL